jgi:hypothetical protein
MPNRSSVCFDLASHYAPFPSRSDKENKADDTDRREVIATLAKEFKATAAWVYVPRNNVQAKRDHLFDQVLEWTATTACELCLKHAVVAWLCGVAVWRGCVAWLCGVAVWRGCVAWLCGVAVWRGCVAWLCGVAVWRGCESVV